MEGDKTKNFWIKLRLLIENKWSNKIYNKTGNDLFDWISIVLLFGGGLLAVTVLYWRDYIAVSKLINISVLWLTALVILRYTRETHQLRKINQGQLKEIKKQTNLQIRPYLKLQWCDEGNDEVFKVINEGESSALNIDFVPFFVSNNRNKVRFNIENRSSIPSGGEVVITTSELNGNLDEIEGEGVEGNAKEYINSAIRAEDHFGVSINYDDLGGNSYQSKFKLDKSYLYNFKIRKQERVN